jgi:nucleoside-diphosphate-sugar epimerase
MLRDRPFSHTSIPYYQLRLDTTISLHADQTMSIQVFVTCATGFLGSCVTKELLANGHSLTGLARNDASAEKVKSQGVTPVKGSLNDLPALTAAAGDTDAIIHMAHIHGFADANQSLTDNVDKVIEALKALAEGLRGTGRRWISAHVSMAVRPRQMFTESMAKHPRLAHNRSDNLFKSLAEEARQVVTIHLPVVVQGERESNFTPAMFQSAKVTGFGMHR